MNREQISKIVDSWIDEEELPVNHRLRVIRKFDDVYPEDWDEDEFEAYWEFIAKGLAKEYEPLLALPKPKKERESWPFQIVESDENSNAFASIDFKRRYPYRFNKEAYILKKIYERVKDLAETYSCISRREGKKNTYEKFKALVKNEFQNWAVWIKKALPKTKDPETRKDLRCKLFKLSCRIQQCNKIWREHAYRE